MELVRELRKVKTHTGITHTICEFKCPECGCILERFKHNGLRQKSCRECANKRISKARFKHGIAGTRLYSIWARIRNICNNRMAPSYHVYGKKGITVSEKWDDYLIFKKWAEGNGYNDKMFLCRKDTTKNFNPDNCYFSNKHEPTSSVKVIITPEVIREMLLHKKRGITLSAQCNKRGFTLSAFYYAKKRYGIK